MRILTSVVVGGAAAGLLLTGCSSSSSSDASSASPTESMASASPTDVLPPIEITGAGKKAVKVGDTLNVNAEGVTKVKTNNAKVLKVSQPSSDGSATMNAGAMVVGPGNARLVVVKPDGKFVVKVTATQ